MLVSHVSTDGMKHFNTHSHQIVHRNVLRNSNDQGNFCFNGILNGLAALLSSDKDSGCVWLELFFCFLQIWQKRQANVLSLLAWGDSSHNIGAVGNAILCVSGSYTPSESLVHHTRVLAYSEIVNGVIVATSQRSRCEGAFRGRVSREGSS